jgi:DNA-binding transcriptional MerR regulator
MHLLRKPVDIDTLLAEVHAAELLGLSSRTLQAWRTKGVGPAFVRAGRAIRYRRRDLIAWMEAHTVVSEQGGHIR